MNTNAATTAKVDEILADATATRMMVEFAVRNGAFLMCREDWNVTTTGGVASELVSVMESYLGKDAPQIAVEAGMDAGEAFAD